MIRKVGSRFAHGGLRRMLCLRLRLRLILMAGLLMARLECLHDG